MEPMSDDDLERVVRAIYRREEAPISRFEESWAALEAALTARQTAMSAPTEAQASADIHEASSDSSGGSDNTSRDISPRGLQRAGRFFVVAGPLAAVLLVSLLAAVIFNAIAHRGAGTGLTLVNQLTWRQVRYPDGVTLRPPQAALGFSTYNGNVAYLCATSTASGALDSPRLWITRNRGATWTRLTDIPDVSGVTGCQITVDSLEPDIVEVWLTQSPPSDLTTFISVDGGQRWRPAPADLKDVHQALRATWQGHTFAIQSTGDYLNGEVQSDLVLSDDSMQTWRPIDETLLAALPKIVAPQPGQPKYHWINQFWLQPSTGELLAETDLGTLWSSPDMGQHWTQRVVPLSVVPPDAIPANATNPEQQGGPIIAASRHFFVQPSAVDQTFQICGEIDVRHAREQVPGPMVAFACSWDGGQTWIARPPLLFAPLCRLCDRIDTPNQNLSVFAMTPDGSLLAEVTPRGMDGADAFCLLPRAATQASEWEYLGPVSPPVQGGGYSGIAMSYDGQSIVLWDASNPSHALVTSYP
jgi:hypothetical protein